MEAAARLRLDALNRALLDELLPTGRDQRTVLLDCDDQTLAAAAARLGASDPPDMVLRETLRGVAPISTERGLRAVLRALSDPPDDLIVLCACVLAASRMSADEVHHTQAYYARLCELLDIEPRDQHPAVAGFERVPGRFHALSEWAASEGRGQLALPEDPWPSLVGVPISQSLLRRVDRVRLGALFDRHRPLAGCRTRPVAAAADEFAALPAHRTLRSGCSSATTSTMFCGRRYGPRTPDGTERSPTNGGGGSPPGPCASGLSPSRVTLNLSLPGVDADMPLAGPDGVPVAIPAWPGELSMPTGWLTFAVDGPVTAEAADGRLVRVLPGPTMLFGVADTGFWLTAAVAEDVRVILLTSEHELAGRDWGHRRARVPLPQGWVLICDVDADELPEDLREPSAGDEESQSAGDVELIGGLRLERGVWLLDHPPALQGRLAEPAVVEVRIGDTAWRELGELQPDERFELDALAHRPGTHAIAVSGHEFIFELADRGGRAGVGELAHRPRDPHLERAGAVSASDAEIYGDPRPVVCGASVDGEGDPAWRPPLTTRADATVHVIYDDGRIEVAGPTPQPQWARQAQLPPGSSWAVPGGEQAVWLCVQSRTHPRVVAVRAADVPLTDGVLDLADWFADAPLVDRSDGLAEARWQEIVRASRVDAEELGTRG